MKLTGSLARSALFWLLSYSPIAVLLGQLYAIGSMKRLSGFLLIPGALLLAGIWVWSSHKEDEAFLIRAKAGWVGGLLGTLGYDFFRIPFHMMGANPLTPIRAYGIWLIGAPHSTLWTDLLGLGYHFSDGLTFGWIYSFLFLRRHWSCAILWALLLETIVVLTPFGDVFGIRGKGSLLLLAYAAHLLYGWPLGWISQKPEERLKFFLPFSRTKGGWGSLFLVGILCAWFLCAWEPIGRQPAFRVNTVVVGPKALYPGFSDARIGTSLLIENRLNAPVSLLLRSPNPANQAGEKLLIEATASRTVNLTQTGIYQLLILSNPWHSVFITVHDRQDYRPK